MHATSVSQMILCTKAYADADQILAFTGMSLLSALTAAVAPPPTCQYKVFLDLYPNPACAVVNTGPVGVKLFEGFFLNPGQCKDTTRPILSFRNAITDDSKAEKCTLIAYPEKGCKGKEFLTRPNPEAKENDCTDYTLATVTSLSLAANSFKLQCS
ncbi:MAG: hypothetical protein Q9169_006782 [Polycauliona sp. 2 TL-2023]